MTPLPKNYKEKTPDLDEVYLKAVQYAHLSRKTIRSKIGKIRELLFHASDAIIWQHEEIARLRKVEQAANDLLCFCHQTHIDVDPSEYSRNVKALGDTAYECMTEAERNLYDSLMGKDS